MLGFAALSGAVLLWGLARWGPQLPTSAVEALRPGFAALARNEFRAAQECGLVRTSPLARRGLVPPPYAGCR